VALAAKDSHGRARFEELVFNLGPAPDGPATIGQDLPGVSSPLPFKEAKAQLNTAFERAYVDALLTRHQRNVTHAAAAAGISRQHLYELMKRATGEAPEE
jgi:DNA-binding NtrC family response regulator